MKPFLPALLGPLLGGPFLAATPVAFDWMEYVGEDPFYAEHALEEGEFYNPVLPGFYPDPSVVRVEEDFYLVNSTFAWFPGVPIFHSRDLVNWTQLGHVLDRPSQLDLDGHRTSRGIFAPTIEHHDGLFYMVTTLIDTRGNFFVTAEDPAGPWSDPVWFDFDGIDPSFFFDESTGRAWLVNNGPPPNNEPLYEGHRAIWLQEFDPAAGELIGERRIVINGGVDLSEEPVWIEGPHIFKEGDWYYLHCAEGGTSVNHRQVVFRSREVTGPYVPWEENPILTQRHLPADRPYPVSATGHADFVEMPSGDWWAVFLATRPYEEDYYSTGRQTFALPVHWTNDGWPDMLPVEHAVPLKLEGPEELREPGPRTMPRGNFTWRDDFSGGPLGFEWVMLRTPRGQPWWHLDAPAGLLHLEARAVPLTEVEAQPSFLGRRQQHHHYTTSLAVAMPAAAGVEAGLVAFLDERANYFLGVRRLDDGSAEVFVERTDVEAETLLSAPIADTSMVRLRLQGRGPELHFAASTDEGATWQELGTYDARILTISHSWGFTGVMLGPYARTAR
ncbi:MAG: glycoside hydrolase family 43 protein [Opitutales bacterium]